jgi:hypothetical protein
MSRFEYPSSAPLKRAIKPHPPASERCGRRPFHARLCRATPLHVTAAYGRESAAELLLAQGADVHAKESFGSSPRADRMRRCSKAAAALKPRRPPAYAKRGRTADGQWGGVRRML